MRKGVALLMFLVSFANPMFLFGQNAELKGQEERAYALLIDMDQKIKSNSDYKNTAAYGYDFNRTKKAIDEGYGKSKDVIVYRLTFAFYRAQLFEITGLRKQASAAYEKLFDEGARASAGLQFVAWGRQQAANIYKLEGEYDTAFFCLMEAERILKTLGTDAYLSDYLDVLNDLGLVYQDVFKNNLAMENYNQMLELSAFKPQFSEQISAALNNVAVLHLHNQDYDSCLASLAKSLKYDPVPDRVYFLTGTAYLERGIRLQDSLSIQKADSLFHFAVDPLKLAEDQRATYFFQVGRLYLQLHQLDSALISAERSYRIAFGNKFLKELMDCSDLFAKISLEAGQTDLHLKYLNSKDVMAGTFFNKIKAYNVAEYANQKEIAALKAKNDRYFFTFIILMISLMIVAFVLSFINMRALYKKIIQLQQFIMHIENGK
jgi:tetratricopeptide (TPR) repeat protein